jgi:hypothetical protein
MGRVGQGLGDFTLQARLADVEGSRRRRRCSGPNEIGTKAVQRPILHVPGKDAAAGAVLIHQQVERSVMLQALLVERLQDGVAGSIGRCTGALRHLLSILDG